MYQLFQFAVALQRRLLVYIRQTDTVVAHNVRRGAPVIRLDDKAFGFEPRNGINQKTAAKRMRLRSFDDLPIGPRNAQGSHAIRIHPQIMDNGTRSNHHRSDSPNVGTIQLDSRALHRCSLYSAPSIDLDRTKNLVASDEHDPVEQVGNRTNVIWCYSDKIANGKFLTGTRNIKKAVLFV